MTSVAGINGPLDNKTDYPTWDALPSQDAPSPVYHSRRGSGQSGTGHRFAPKRHWCFLSEIVECDGFGRYRTEVRDAEGDEANVAFYFDNYADFDFRTIKEGHTMAIMYAHQHYFLDGTSGVRVENPEHVRVFPLALIDMQCLGVELEEYAKVTDGNVKCHACDRTAPQTELNRCGKCLQFYYCDKDCQTEGWLDKEHKYQCKVLRDPAFQALTKLDFHNYETPFSFKVAAANAALRPRPAAQSSEPAAPSSTVLPQPPAAGVPPSTPTSIVAISLNHQPYFDDMYGSLMNAISSKVTLERIDTAQAALRAISSQPSAVLLTDEALTKYRNRNVWDAVLDYVRAGGTAIVMGHFSSMAKPPDFAPFFAKAGLQWSCGSYHRTTVAVNDTAVGGDIARQIPARYSQKAVFLKNVDRVAAWYLPDEDSRIESLVFAPERVADLRESPVVFAKVGEGNLGYVGDVNAEEESHDVVLAMCGLKG